jgi:hypothetical protein
MIPPRFCRGRYHFSVICMTLVVSYLLIAIPSAAQVKTTVLPDGIIKYEGSAARSHEPSFWEIFRGLFQVAPPRLPFERSFAFLIGVSSYEYLNPELPYVRTDLEDMRKFLIEKAGFDVVYVAVDGVVNTETIENYMVNVLPKQIGENDRLLFYYSGHGADIGGATGYMQFSQARQGVFDSNQYLAITRTEEWSHLTRAKHALFLIDSCASGLGFESKSGSSNVDEDLLNTLSGNGSRFVITAGTAREKAFEFETSSTQGYSVFTHAFLEALESNSEGYRGKGFLVLDEVFADAKVRVGRFASSTGQKMTPRLWSIPRDDKDTGTFIFINKDMTGAALTTRAKIQLGIAKDASGNPVANSSGTTDSIVAVRTVRPTPAPVEVSAKTNGFVFVIESCRSSGGLLSCTGSASNKMGKSRLLDINAQTEGVSVLIDDHGTQYELIPPARNTILFGASGRRQQLETDIPVTFQITVPEFSSSANSVNIVLACWTDQPYGFFKATLRHVPVASR